MSPIYIRNPNRFLNGGFLYLKVPCGKCVNCNRNKRSEWLTRLVIHNDDNPFSYFVTLTYSDDQLYYNVNNVPSVNKKHVQDFLKRFRKSIGISGITYFIGSEYSPAGRPHYHALLFGLPNDIEYVYDEIVKSWQHGFINIGQVTPASINYVCHYFVARNLVHPDSSDVNFNLISNGISRQFRDSGKLSYLERQNAKKVVYHFGEQLRFPRYFNNAISDDSRQRFNKLSQDFYDSKQLPSEADIISIRHHMDKFLEKIKNKHQ